MRHARNHARRGQLEALDALRITSGALLIAFAAGCGGGAPTPRIADGAYDGPPLSIDQSGRTAVVIMEAPTPGWSVTVDRSSEARDHWQAFVTVRRPNPAYMYAQMIVRQNLLTTVESRRPLRVYARVLEFTDEAIDGEYREAVRAAPVAPQAEPPRPEMPRVDPLQPDVVAPAAEPSAGDGPTTSPPAGPGQPPPAQPEAPRS